MELVLVLVLVLGEVGFFVFLCWMVVMVFVFIDVVVEVYYIWFKLVFLFFILFFGSVENNGNVNIFIVVNGIKRKVIVVEDFSLDFWNNFIKEDLGKL